MHSKKSEDAYKDFLEDIGQFSSGETGDTLPQPKMPEQAGEPTSIGQRVRLVREEKGMTTEDVGQRTGLSPNYLDLPAIGRLDQNRQGPRHEAGPVHLSR